MRRNIFTLFNVVQPGRSFTLFECFLFVIFSRSGQTCGFSAELDGLNSHYVAHTNNHAATGINLMLFMSTTLLVTEP